MESEAAIEHIQEQLDLLGVSKVACHCLKHPDDDDDDVVNDDDVVDDDDVDEQLDLLRVGKVVDILVEFDKYRSKLKIKINLLSEMSRLVYLLP